MENTPELIQTGHYFYYNNTTQFSAPEKSHTETKPAAEHFAVEDLLDFPNDDVSFANGTLDTVTTGNSTDSPTVTINSSFCGGEPHFSSCDIACRSFADAQFSSDLCVPYHDDLAELEWLSNFVDESFSSEELRKLQIISGVNAQPDEESETHGFEPEQKSRNCPKFHPELPVPGKARSKRSRAAPCNWASLLSVLSPDATSASKKREGEEQEAAARDLHMDRRKCLHCATDKTPQWRTGPMGPKTLCNACGVRYKSGRLVPEYRPAASPTFKLTKHSNSHRKVMELRRQKEVQRAQQQHQQQFFHQNMVYDVSNGDDYLIHHNIGPDYGHMI
ncbi:hypothetical protein RHMOL_Rhmol02G0221700 [Rhododendron molle]|uniref:Uncharacterized protein n=1 Tax=Rhododendron molle TaxID=49168 RepID=A0ACC0PTA4_RHOML|nr:hypothetical protein RHMOL_Rhmol02G0221700 [Rhododendron molle]